MPATPSAFPAPPAGDPRARLSFGGRRSRMLPREAAVRCDPISRQQTAPPKSLLTVKPEPWAFLSVRRECGNPAPISCPPGASLRGSVLAVARGHGVVAKFSAHVLGDATGLCGRLPRRLVARVFMQGQRLAPSGTEPDHEKTHSSLLARPKERCDIGQAAEEIRGLRKSCRLSVSVRASHPLESAAFSRRIP